MDLHYLSSFDENRKPSRKNYSSWLFMITMGITTVLVKNLRTRLSIQNEKMQSICRSDYYLGYAMCQVICIEYWHCRVVSSPLIPSKRLIVVYLLTCNR